MALLIGLFRSDVLSTSLKPTIVFVIPETVPVNSGLFNGAFVSNAVCVALLIGLFISEVLFTLLNPIIHGSIPDTVPVN